MNPTGVFPPVYNPGPTFGPNLNPQNVGGYNPYQQPTMQQPTYTRSESILPEPSFGGYQQQSMSPIYGQQTYTQDQRPLSQEEMNRQYYEYQKKMQALETPQIVSNGSNRRFFSVVEDPKNNPKSMVPVDNIEVEQAQEKKRRAKKKEVSEGESVIVRASKAAGDKQEVERVSGTVEETSSAYSYMETTGMLREVMGQIDAVNSELMREFDMVKHSRTMKNKHNVMIGLSENVGSLLSNKINAIKEINATITKANDLDYKKDKDRRAAAANVDDDKYIADLYKSFMNNNGAALANPQVPQIDPSIYGSSVVRANMNTGNTGITDAGYLNYMSNLSPEQNAMRYENNANVKQVLVFDASTGHRFFQYMDMSTGQAIPNMPVYDDLFLDEFTIDRAKGIAKSNNLNEVMPLVVINEGVTENY